MSNKEVEIIQMILKCLVNDYEMFLLHKSRDKLGYEKLYNT